MAFYLSPKAYEQQRQDLPSMGDSITRCCEHCGQPLPDDAKKSMRFCPIDRDYDGAVIENCQMQATKEKRRNNAQRRKQRAEAVKAEATQRYCLNCGVALAGKQRKFDSDACRKQYERDAKR